MTFSDDKIEAFNAIFKETGFKYFDGERYYFSNGKSYHPSKFLSALGFPARLEEYECLASVALALVRKKFPHEAFDTLVEEWSRPNLPVMRSAFTLPVIEGSAIAPDDFEEYVRGLVPVFDVTNKSDNTLLLLDPKRDFRPILDIKPDVYLTYQGVKIEELIRDPNVMKVMTTFNPFIKESLFTKETESNIVLHHVNLHIPPDWYFLDVAPKFSGPIADLIFHVVPDEEDREYLLDWLHYLITGRNECMLCLLGPRGTGKSILTTLAGALVGFRYREIVNPEIFVDKFNGSVEGKRLIICEEGDIENEKMLNRIKAMSNSQIALEKKSKDLKTINNFTSMILTSNKRDGFKVEPQERRFSAVRVTTEPLTNSMPGDEIKKLVDSINDPKYSGLAEFGNFLKQRVPKYSCHTPFKGKYFFELCRLSLPEWKSFIIEYVRTKGKKGEIISYSALSSDFNKGAPRNNNSSKMPTKRGTVEEFLSQYVHEGEARIGEVVDVESEKKYRTSFGIIPEDDFLDKFATTKKTEEMSIKEMVDFNIFGAAKKAIAKNSKRESAL